MSDQFKQCMEEWITIKKQLKIIKDDVKTLNTKEKELRVVIQEYMKTQGVTHANISDMKAKVSLNTRVSKPSFSKALVLKGLLKYFNGDEDRVQYVMDIILDSGESTEKDSVTLKIV